MSAARLIPAAFCATLAMQAQAVDVRIDAAKVTAHVSPALYGLMTEEINYSYDGGLYGELVRNRSFREDPAAPVHWTLVQDHGGAGAIALESPAALKLTVTAASGNQPVGIANDGFWGMRVNPATRYLASIRAKAEPGFNGPLTVSIVSNDGVTVYATAQIPHLAQTWQKYQAVLTTGKVAPTTAAAHLLISASQPGTISFSFVSLFPPTYRNRSNGNRPDIMQLLADMHPSFLRFPGGNYLEGDTIATRFDWKKTIGDISGRPGHLNDSWKYWSSDGMGLLEFLDWCEDLHMRPLLAIYAGYSLHQERVKPGPDLAPYVQDGLDEIEYVTGGVNTKWGARRAHDGHPAPFPLDYVEIGNEDQFDREPGSYDGRFTQFFDAIKARYPRLNVIATTNVKTRVPDVIDEHYYRRTEDEMASHAHDYDTRSRSGPKVFVGEWATRVGEPTPNMSAALGDAAWMTGMERNSDLVIMSSYAPLFVNVNPGGMQWRTNLIGFDALSSYGSPAYYAQQMFSRNHGDEVLALEATGIPTREWQPPAPRGKTALPPRQQVPLLFFDATRDSKTSSFFLKVINRAATPQPVHMTVSGARINPKGRSITLSAASPDDTNSITEPRKIIPVTAPVEGLGPDFTRTFPPYSITILLCDSL